MKTIKYLILLAIVISFSTCTKGIFGTCFDNKKNQDETDIDCGGVCNACVPWVGKHGYGLPGEYFIRMISNGNDIYLSNLAGIVGRSSDNCDNFSLVNHTFYLNQLRANGGNLYAVSDFGIIYKSKDNGLQWDSVSRFPIYNFPDFGGNCVEFSGTNIYGITRCISSSSCNRLLIYFSSDNGVTWTSADISSGDDAEFLCSYNNKLYVTMPDGIFVTDIGTNNWTRFNHPAIGFVTSMAINGSNIFLGGETGLKISNDNGLNWTSAKANGKDFGLVTKIAATGSTVLLSCSTEGTYISKDNGLSWTITTGLPQSPSISSFVIVGNNIFALTYQGVYMRPL